MKQTLNVIKNKTLAYTYILNLKFLFKSKCMLVNKICMFPVGAKHIEWLHLFQLWFICYHSFFIVLEKVYCYTDSYNLCSKQCIYDCTDRSNDVLVDGIVIVTCIGEHLFVIMITMILLWSSIKQLNYVYITDSSNIPIVMLIWIYIYWCQH